MAVEKIKQLNKETDKKTKKLRQQAKRIALKEAEKRKAKKPHLEMCHQILLWESVGGRMEVCTPHGFIDILTDTEVIEVKRYRRWKDAIGQLLAYGKHYPNHTKRLHVFDVPPSKMHAVSDICDPLGIVVTPIFRSPKSQHDNLDQYDILAELEAKIVSDRAKRRTRAKAKHSDSYEQLSLAFMG